MSPKLLCHIVTFNSARSVAAAVESILSQKFPGEIIVQVTDNSSTDNSVEIVSQRFSGKLELFVNAANLGFSAAHNQAVKRFLEGAYDLLFIANPDLRLESDALEKMSAQLISDPAAGMATPKLFRADRDLNLSVPPTLDACGMILDRTLRHFDRGSGQSDSSCYNRSEYVFGGTGAALLLKRSCVEDLLLAGEKFDSDSGKIYPQLSVGRENRSPLFDEAFFAYREDADLAWRANLLGWKTLYVPDAIGYHTRVVLPERRAELPAQINSWSVRNRFLMQIANFSFRRDLNAILPGLIFRNLIVILAVLLKERSSWMALRELWVLRNRAFERRSLLMRRAQKVCQKGHREPTLISTP